MDIHGARLVAKERSRVRERSYFIGRSTVQSLVLPTRSRTSHSSGLPASLPLINLVWLLAGCVGGQPLNSAVRPLRLLEHLSHEESA